MVTDSISSSHKGGSDNKNGSSKPNPYSSNCFLVTHIQQKSNLGLAGLNVLGLISPAVRQPSPSRTAGDKRRPGTACHSLRPLFPFARAARVSPHSRRSSASQRPILDDSKRRVSWPRRWPPDPSAPASLRRPPRRACGDIVLRLLPRPRLHRRRLRPAR